MAVIWEVIDVDRNNKNHAMTVCFRETDGANRRDYHITLPDGATRQDYMVALKKEVLEARRLRQRVENMKASINSAQIEAFINS